MNTIIKSILLFCTVLIAIPSFAQNVDQKVKDDQDLKAYFSKKKLKPVKTASGLYYVITKQGSGDNAQKGERVTMNYVGKFLDGRKFDGNIDEQGNSIRPFQFTLGVGQVIPGWDEGVQLLNLGSKATIFLPSGLGYGPGGVGPIPPNSILVFDVEVVNIAR